MNKFYLLAVLIGLTGCATTTDMRKLKTEDCVVRLVNNDIPPLKAERICQGIYHINSNDLEEIVLRDYAGNRE